MSTVDLESGTVAPGDEPIVNAGSAERGVRVGAVVVLLALAFAGGFVARGSAGVTDPSRVDPPNGVDQLAPALDESQLRGGLPSGHPPIGQPGSTTTPSAGPTAVKPLSPSGKP
jgi:hypothetical protein